MVDPVIYQEGCVRDCGVVSVLGEGGVDCGSSPVGEGKQGLVRLIFDFLDGGVRGGVEGREGVGGRGWLD